jgi:hypothetical protein
VKSEGRAVLVRIEIIFINFLFSCHLCRRLPSPMVLLVMAVISKMDSVMVRLMLVQGRG